MNNMKDTKTREIVDPIIFRYRGLRKDGTLIESNNPDDYRLQEFFWFEEIATMTPEMYENLRLRGKLPVFNKHKE